MSLTPEEIDAIALKTSEHMTDKKRAQWVDPDTHAEHHDWVKRQMVSEEEKRKIKQKIIQSAIVWAAPICLGFVATALWHAFKNSVNNGG